ncbi:MAG: hypothetical protein QXS54_10670 [Candidatus Methanomethylicaceae archaeon]
MGTVELVHQVTVITATLLRISLRVAILGTLWMPDYLSRTVSRIKRSAVMDGSRNWIPQLPANPYITTTILLT